MEATVVFEISVYLKVTILFPHHRNDTEKINKLARIDLFYSEQFAYFLNNLSKIKEIDGSRLIDHCAIVFGSGISDGNSHRHSNLPILLAGGKALGFSNALHKDCGGVPMSNLFLSILGKAEVGVSQVGDSTGALMGVSTEFVQRMEF